MTSRALPLAVVTGLALALSGCASTSNAEATETSSAISSSSDSATSSSSEKSASSSSRSSADTRRAEKESSEALASKSSASSDGPRSSWRNDRDSQRDARSSSVGASGDTAKLVEQLNDASRELATLRAQNAKLRAERAQPAPASSSSPAASVASASAKVDPADEKLAASLKSYAQFKQEMVAIFAEVERVRKENAGMSANLKAAVEQADHARATIAKLEIDLRAERKSRAEAEYAATQLRDQLRTIARALNSAGLSVEKISSATETASR